MKPNEINSDNAQQTYERLYEYTYEKNDNPKYKAGDIVRVIKDKGIFSKGYHPSFTKELFKITAAKETKPPHYKLQDLNGNQIKGVFYDPEISFVRLGEGDQIGGSFKPKLWVSGKSI